MKRLRYATPVEETREKGASENNTGCKVADRAKVRLYLAILDRLWFNKGMKFTPEAANKEGRLSKDRKERRLSKDRKERRLSKDRLELPAGVFPLHSVPIWRELLYWKVPKEDRIKKQGSIGNKAKPRPGLIAKAYKDSVIYLPEFLELLYFVHKKSYKHCDFTFQYYGAIVFKKSDFMQSISSRYSDGQDSGLPKPYFYSAEVPRNLFRSKTYLTHPHLLSSDSFSVMECVMRHSSKLVKSDESILPIRNKIHSASIRSIFVDRSVTLLTHMWPSLVHFLNFPKDKQMFLKEC
jgi:hypothetical protein